MILIMTEKTLSQRIAHACNNVRVSDLCGFCGYSKHHITYCHFHQSPILKLPIKYFRIANHFFIILPDYFFILSPFKFLNRPIFTCLTNSFGKSVGYFLLEGSHGYKDSFLSIVIKVLSIYILRLQSHCMKKQQFLIMICKCGITVNTLAFRVSHRHSDCCSLSLDDK